MTLTILSPLKALNKAFLKLKPTRIDFDIFKTNLISLIHKANKNESKEFHKNLISDFLKNTYYKQNHFINTKNRIDLVIHNGNSANSAIGVIIEAKKITNRNEMLTVGNINTKALHELILYYLRERITNKNVEIKHVIATNINEWFIFDAIVFDKLFAQNNDLVKKFIDFEERRLSDTTTDFFYSQIAQPFVDSINSEIEFTHFKLDSFKDQLESNNKDNDNKLIALYKLFSPEHLLKLPFANDSNSLDKNFYNELLHIMGLTETKEGSKKLIERLKEGGRHDGSILEDAIIQLDSLDKISRLPKPHEYGNTHQERLFNASLELTITWVNRILFLKLLEAQLIGYHQNDKNYSFLNLTKIKNYNELNGLFFQVLARKHNERNENIKHIFEKVPYLNSSLFEPTELEQLTLVINNLSDNKTIPILTSTVLTNQQGKKQHGSLPTLQYLFEFLDAYDFGAEGQSEIQEENKTLINASVLGLIFEKINGYKDGSFFTPGFITMYMCSETIRKAVVQKFNEIKNWSCTNFEELYNKIEDKNEANQIVNNLKICDPAVGSGHFLVSALNEIIAVKNDLKILQDRTGKRLKEYHIEVVNDELSITDEDGELYRYNPNNKESQRVQETLFYEKQTIIENCLFGVDINTNSVKICRLRLWIELLKNAYYKNSGELETLPNIDINIKCGNSLISRFAIDADIKQALKKSKWSIDSYKTAVATYRNAQNKEQKREMIKLIADIKAEFKTEISQNDPKIKKLRKLLGDLFIHTNQSQLFEMNKQEKTNWQNKVTELTQETKQLETEIEEIKNNKIFDNAFEWRFEFPEVLNDEGTFIGFDIVIGNPPYIQLQTMKIFSEQLKTFGYVTFEKTGDIYSLFYEKGYHLLKVNGLLGYITSNKWLKSSYGKSTRNFFLQHTQPELLVDLGSGVFDEATVDSNLLVFKKCSLTKAFNALDISKQKNISNIHLFESNMLQVLPKTNKSWIISSNKEQKIKLKIETKGKPLKDWNIQINYGIKTGYNEVFIIDSKKRDEFIRKHPKSAEIIKPILRKSTITKYNIKFDNEYLLNIHNGLKSNKLKAINIENYKIIKKHIDDIVSQIETGNKRRKGGHKSKNKSFFERTDKGITAYNLRNCAYLAKLSLPKIMWKQTSINQTFVLDESGFFTDVSGQFLTIESNEIKTLKYILSILNSKIVLYFMHTNSIKFGELGIRWIPAEVEKIPIPVISEKAQKPFISLVDKILTKKPISRHIYVRKTNRPTDLSVV